MPSHGRAATRAATRRRQVVSMLPYIPERRDRRHRRRDLAVAIWNKDIIKETSAPVVCARITSVQIRAARAETQAYGADL